MHQRVRDVPHGVHVAAASSSLAVIVIVNTVASLDVIVIVNTVTSLTVDVDPPACHAPAAVPDSAAPAAPIVIVGRARPVPTVDGAAPVPAVADSAEEQRRVVIVFLSLGSVLALLFAAVPAVLLVEPVLLLLPLREQQEPRRVERLRRCHPRAAPARRHLLEVRCWASLCRRAYSGELFVCL